MISAAARRALAALKEAEDREDWDDAEIVCDGRSCYVGLDKVSRATVYELLRFVLIRDQSDVKGMERYSINAEGRAILADPEYRPEILSHLNSPSGDGNG